MQFQRPALLLNAGSVWVLFGSGLSELVSFHGWAIIYSAGTLQQTGVWCGTITGNGAGIWMSGRGAAADSNGVYLATGIGSEGPGNSGQSVIRFSGTPEAPVDYFLPYNYAAMNRSDWDLGSSGPILMPGTSLLVQGGKHRHDLRAKPEQLRRGALRQHPDCAVAASCRDLLGQRP